MPLLTTVSLIKIITVVPIVLDFIYAKDCILRPSVQDIDTGIDISVMISMINRTRSFSNVEQFLAISMSAF